MSVRAVAVRGGAHARLRVVPRELRRWPATTAARPRVEAIGRRVIRFSPQRAAMQIGLWTRLADDRQLIGLKLMLLVLMILIAMALEVPL